MNNKRLHQEMTKSSDQIVAKKTKISPTIPEYLKNIKNVYKNCELIDLFKNLKEIEGFDYDSDFSEDLGERCLQNCENGKIDTEKYTLAEKICAFMFYGQCTLFPVCFKKCLFELMEKICKMEQVDKIDNIGYYLMQEYDYENNAKDDFSFQSFLSQKKFGESQLICVVSNEDQEQMKETIVELLKLWLEGDMKLLSIAYCDYFCNFLQAYNELMMLEHPTVIRFHNKCLMHIMNRIAFADKDKFDFGHVLIHYQLNQKANEWTQKNHIDKEKDSTWEPYLNGIKKMTDEERENVFKEVCKWDGLCPFDGFIDGNDSVKQMFDKIDKSKQIYGKYF